MVFNSVTKKNADWLVMGKKVIIVGLINLILIQLFITPTDCFIE